MSNLSSLIKVLENKPTVDLVMPSDPRYANARLIYNRMHDCHPGIIIRTMDVDDLRIILKYVFTHNIELAIRGGGHHIGGYSTCNNGIVIDFSTFKDVHINTELKIATVLPGACLSNVDQTLCPQGYVIPSGTISETGIAGLTLGGGIGWLIGKYGLTCDQLCGADVLLANGDLIRAEDPEHEDLLWALKGGGGNFGIVLKFRYRLNPLPKTICGMGTIAWENTAHVMSLLNHYLLTRCPASLTVAPVFIKNKLGQPTFRIDFCCADGTEDDIAALLSLSSFITWSHVKKWDFVKWQSEFDQILLPPKRGYWKASYIKNLTADIINTLCHTFENSPDGECTILIEHLHGTFKRFGHSTSAFPLRETDFGVLFSSRWLKSTEDKASIDWVRNSFNAVDPHGATGTYSNYTSADDNRAVTTLLSSTFNKIQKVKAHYDPQNNFKRNHNVLPRSAQLV